MQPRNRMGWNLVGSDGIWLGQSWMGWDGMILCVMEWEKMQRENKRKKKEGKKVMSTTNKAVAVTAVGVSWLTAGIATGGLVIAATLVAAGITVTAGSMGGKLFPWGR